MIWYTMAQKILFVIIVLPPKFTGRQQNGGLLCEKQKSSVPWDRPPIMIKY